MELTNLKNIVPVCHKKKPHPDNRDRALVMILFKKLIV